MKTVVDRKMVRESGLILLMSIVAVLAFPGVAGAMQEYEEIKVFVAEIEAFLNSIMIDSYPEDLDIMQLIFDEPGSYQMILALVDEVEREMTVARAKANRRSTVKAQDL
jgi:hypothetical protein